MVGLRFLAEIDLKVANFRVGWNWRCSIQLAGNFTTISSSKGRPNFGGNRTANELDMTVGEPHINARRVLTAKRKFLFVDRGLIAQEKRVDRAGR